jgi:hypothetical protein
MPWPPPSSPSLQDDLAPRVGFVVGIGGYRDAESVIRFVTTGSFRPRDDSREHRREPSGYARWAFLVANARPARQPGRRLLLEEIGRLRFHDRNADISRQVAELGEQGRAILALVEKSRPRRGDQAYPGAAGGRAPRDR